MNERMTSPLGKYANIGAFVASMFIVAASVLTHAFGSDDPFLDNLAILAFGVLMGQIGARSEATIFAAEKLNGHDAKVDALHRRLDALESRSES